MTEESSFPSIYRRSGGALLIVLLLFNLLTLGRIPEVPHGDDGGYAAAAYQFWQTGHPGVPGYRDLLGLDKDILVFGRTAAAVQGIFMYLFGVSLFTALLPSVLAGIGLIWATYGFGWVLWGKECALVAVILLTASGMFFIASHSVRPDILLAFYLFVTLYLFASAPPGRWSWRYLAAGLIMGLSGDVHLNGFLLVPIPFLFWVSVRRENISLRMKRCGYLFWRPALRGDGLVGASLLA